MLREPSNFGIKAIVENPNDVARYWLLDLVSHEGSELHDVAHVESVFHHNVVILRDGKNLLKKLGVDPKPHHRIICLQTIKKLISKSIHDDINDISFSSFYDALSFFEHALSQALELLERRSLSELAHLECQVIIATLAMEIKGVPFNKMAWQRALVLIDKEANRQKEELSEALPKGDGFLLFAPTTIDLNNAKVVKTALEKILDRKLASTSQNELNDIDHPVVKLLLKYRENMRMLSMYGPNFLDTIKDDRLRGHFNPIGCASGRFSCSEPNLLALPNHPLFQECLEPNPPKQLVHFDYGAFELRILAGMSDDPALVDIFNRREDIHSMVAKAVFNVEVSKTINSHLRDQAKILNFGIIYGMGEHALAKKLKISFYEAQDILNNYFKRFKAVREFLVSLEADAHKKGFVTTAIGRRAYFDKNSDRDAGYISRLARNIPIQGTGADIVKLAMCKVFKRLHDENLDAHLVNLVHDELVIEANAHDEKSASNIVIEAMENAFTSVLPKISAEVSVSVN